MFWSMILKLQLFYSQYRLLLTKNKVYAGSSWTNKTLVTITGLWTWRMPEELELSIQVHLNGQIKKIAMSVDIKTSPSHIRIRIKNKNLILCEESTAALLLTLVTFCTLVICDNFSPTHSITVMQTFLVQMKPVYFWNQVLLKSLNHYSLHIILVQEEACIHTAKLFCY